MSQKNTTPRYHQLTPMLGELQWNLPLEDALLEIQLAWINELKREFPVEILNIRQGFTGIGLTWKNAQSQKRFMANYPRMAVKPEGLSRKIWEVPVCYESDYGTDLGSLAILKHMRVNDIIDLHTKPLYRIHFYGFLPGFMYLNGLTEALHTPRKKVPDRAILPGSVAIGGTQTGIYPMESPGGWHILGRTPVPLFMAERHPPVWAEIGERIQFVRISADEMKEMMESPTLPKFR